LYETLATLATGHFVGFCLLINSMFPLLAHSQESETNRKQIYLFSSEFPPNTLAQYPAPPIQETKFWQLLDKEFAATPDLALTENLEDADYQVELRCGGIINCTKMIVDVKDSKRTLLTTFTMNNFPFGFNLIRLNLPYVTQQLTQKLDDHIQKFSQGGYGYTEEK